MRGTCSCLLFLAVAVAVTATGAPSHPALPWSSTVPLPSSKSGKPVVATTDDLIIVPSTDSKATVVALDAHNGRVMWQHKDTSVSASQVDHAVIVQDAYCFTAVGAVTCLEAKTGALRFSSAFVGGAAMALTGAVPWSSKLTPLVAVLTREALTAFFVNNGTKAWFSPFWTLEKVSVHFVSSPESCAGVAGNDGVFLIAGPSQTRSVSFHGVIVWVRSEPTWRFEAQPTAADSARFLGIWPSQGLGGLFPCGGYESASYGMYRPTHVVFSRHPAFPAFVAAKTGVTPAVTIGIYPFSGGVLFNVSLPELSLPGASIHAGWGNEGAFLTASRKAVTIFSSYNGTKVKAVAAPHLPGAGAFAIGGVTKAAAVVIGKSTNSTVSIHGVPLE